MQANEQITLYYKCQLVYGAEQFSDANARLAAPEVERGALAVYPNPAASQFTITGAKPLAKC